MGNEDYSELHPGMESQPVKVSEDSMYDVSFSSTVTPLSAALLLAPSNSITGPL